MTAPFFLWQKERDSFSRWRCGRVVCAVSYCSVGELLRNRKPCAYNQKVNKFPFRLSAQCLQLRCSPPPQYIFCLLCSNLRRPFKSWLWESFEALRVFYAATVDGSTSRIQSVAVWQSCLRSELLAF